LVAAAAESTINRSKFSVLQQPGLHQNFSHMLNTRIGSFGVAGAGQRDAHFGENVQNSTMKPFECC